MYNMNKIILKFLLAENNVIPEVHLRQVELTYSTSGKFTKINQKTEIQDIFIETN